MMNEPLPPDDGVSHQRHGAGGAFVLEQDGRHVGELTYSRDGDVARLVHTGVDKAARGSGAGTRLVEAAVRWARAEHVRLVPACPFARKVLAERADLQDVVAAG